jgi:DNA invertase Pin-like site-specific DNA recombinase
MTLAGLPPARSYKSMSKSKSMWSPGLMTPVLKSGFPATDTTTAHGRLMLTVLGGLAEFERELIRTRTSEGRARAVANGVRLGRKPTLTPHQRQEAIKRVSAEKETLGEIARSYNVSRWTISRLTS